MLTSFQRTGPRDFAGFVFDPGNPDRRFLIEILVDGAFYAAVRADRFDVGRLPVSASEAWRSRYPALPGLPRRLRRLAMTEPGCDIPSTRSGFDCNPPATRERREGVAGQPTDEFDREVGDGSSCGFALTLPDDLLAGARIIEAWVANTDAIVGAPISLADPTTSQAPIVPGEIRWLGGLHVSGWSAADDPLLLLVDGVLAERVLPNVWRHVAGPTEHDTIARAFTVHLPERFADGAIHHCAVVTTEGVELAGSPFALLAWPDTLERIALDGRASRRDTRRARLFDRLAPASVSFVDYEAWRSRSDVATSVSGTECAVVLVGDGDADTTIASLRGQTHRQWLAATLPPQGPAGFAPECLADVLRGDAELSSVLIFALAGTVLYSAALARFCAVFAAHPEAEISYCDLDLRAQDGTLWPLAFPAFDRERLLEQGYCAHLFALRRETAQRALASGATDLYGLFMAASLVTTDGPRGIVHLPDAAATLPDFDRAAASRVLAASSLAHLASCGLHATAAAGQHGTLPAIRIRRSPPASRVTIMIPTRNRRDLLETCLDSIRPAVRRHEAEVLILDNDTSEPEALRFLDALERQGLRRIVVPGPFNFARMNNRGAQAATGALLCLLNNDVRAEDADWLETLLGSLAEPDVGAVAPLLLWPSRVVQHGGLVLGPRFEAAHAFTDRMEGDAGYGDLLRVAHECSAVTAACLLTRRSDYLAVGGMDADRFPINFNDVDYCLKLRAAGRRVIFTPHARLIHAESSSRGRSWTQDRQRLFDRERRALQMKWGEVLMDDPYYSPVLALTPHPYAALSSREPPMTPRFNVVPLARALPDGF